MPRRLFVINYCPLAFLEESGCNRTPDKLPTVQSAPLFEACDTHLIRAVEKYKVKVGQILHPSPASPAANRGWAEAATKQLVQLGIWK